MRGSKGLGLLFLAFFLGLLLYRFSFGLGKTTAMSDNYPWGLWMSVKLCFIALSAGAFCIAAAVHIFHRERYKPLFRLSVLVGLIGYTLFNIALFIDLGRPLRIWHPIIFWQPHSVLFEIAWCVMLYSSVLAVEFSPSFFERMGWRRTLKALGSLTVPLAILGAILSTLHQSSLGALFLIMPEKVHPLWYSLHLPLFFFISAVFSGLAFLILTCLFSARVYTGEVPLDLLRGLAKAQAVALLLYAILLVSDLLSRRVFSLLFPMNLLSGLFLAEVGLGVLVPAFLLLIPAVRESQQGLGASSLLVIFGLILNRMNVSLIGIKPPEGASYFPSWMEFAMVACLIASAFLGFTMAVRHLKVFPEKNALPQGNS